jgi:hypothetical protein
MLIHTYNYGDGGIGDMLRSMLAYFVYCKKNNIEYYIYFNNHPYEFCFKKQNIPIKENDIVYRFIDIGSTSTEKTRKFLEEILDTSKIWIIRSNIFDFEPDIKKYTKQFLEFLELSDIIKERLNKFNFDYVSIHIRRGDIFMPNVNIQSDSRLNDIDKIISNISDIKKDIKEPVLIFSDSVEIKKYYQSESLNTNIHHTAIKTNDYQKDIQGTIDSVFEFFVIGNSTRVISLSNSGFSYWAAFIHDKPIYKYVDGKLEIMNIKY